ncbi:MAG: hypothetical protein EA351_05060 [Gemmatimonadales bacterium]|nr:MAG: hypothetical protein EA351_05060 [Gemmatimonadales bacterium]
MKRAFYLPLAGLLVLLAACGPGEVLVTAEIDVNNPETGQLETRPLGDLELQLLPFDRDAVFDSLTEAAPRPEPELSDELEERRQEYIEVQAAARDAEIEWLTRRERLQEINREMEQYSAGETRYRELFNEFEDQEDRLNAAEATMNRLFGELEELQATVLDQLQQARLQQETWEDEAFADYGDVVAAKLSEAGRDIGYDTTDATGMARLQLQPGTWWIHTRHRLPTEELYWNVRVEVERGDPIEVLLNRSNAATRPVL